MKHFCAGLFAPLLILAAPANAAEPDKEPGAMSDWQLEVPIMSGDQWANLLIDIDEKGQPTNCRIAKTNVRSKERLFYFCRAYRRDWETQPLMKDGVAVPGTVERTVIMRGKAGAAAEEKARKKYKAAQAAAGQAPSK